MLLRLDDTKKSYLAIKFFVLASFWLMATHARLFLYFIIIYYIMQNNMPKFCSELVDGAGVGE
jgi:hypothetical protein